MMGKKHDIVDDIINSSESVDDIIRSVSAEMDDDAVNRIMKEASGVPAETQNKNALDGNPNSGEPAVDLTEFDKKPYFFGLGALVLGAICLGLFFVPAIGLVGLGLSIVLNVAAVSLFRTQKQRAKMPLRGILLLIGYILFLASLVLFIGGIVYMLFF